MKNAQWIIFGLFLSCTSYGHRYVCNGFVASGEERNDKCGVCDDEHAARWPNPNIPVTVGKSPLPQAISLADWDSVVDKSLAAWNDVSGSNLRFFKVDAENPRDFGGDDSTHEIFWIDDIEEWRTFVGVGEFGTLGATLPRYKCGEEEGQPRRIYDADLVLNGLRQKDGTPIVNWQVKCEDDDCISIQTTLVHELGHFFGLDHPCLMCSTSIMSARAGFDLMYPVFDDMAGLRILYPDASGGGFGSPCKNTKECLEGSECIVDGSNEYCSKKCRGDQDCELGAICHENAGKKFCTFMGEKSVEARKLGENCSRVECAEPFACAGAVRGEYYCFMPCLNKSDCPLEQNCVDLTGGVSLCVTIKKKGEICDGKALCDHNLYCIIEAGSNQGTCHEACGLVNASGSGCPEGETCRIFGPGEELCVPLSLALDESSSGFDNAKPTGLGRSGKGPESLSGCSALGSPEGLSWWLSMALAMLLVRRRRQIIS